MNIYICLLTDVYVYLHIKVPMHKEYLLRGATSLTRAYFGRSLHIHPTAVFAATVRPAVESVWAGLQRAYAMPCPEAPDEPWSKFRFTGIR